MTCIAQRLGPWLLFLSSRVACSFACYSGCCRDALKVHPCIRTSFEKSDRAENLCTTHGCKENWLSANSQLLLPWSLLPNALSGKTCRWPRHSYSQLYELEKKRLHWGYYEDGCRDMNVSSQLVGGFCSHTHAPFTSWLSNGFWNWAHDTRECNVCIWGNEQTPLNGMPGWRSTQTLVSETSISLPPSRLREALFFFSVCIVERIRI